MQSNIRTYTAPDRTLRPDEKGFAAWETAGRRLGPLYGQMAQDYRQIGDLQAQEIRGRAWPLDVLALKNSGGGGGIRIAQGGRSRAGDGTDHNAVGQVATGAGALGDYLSNNSPGARDSAWGLGESVNGLVLDTTDNSRMVGQKTIAGTSWDLQGPAGDFSGGADVPTGAATEPDPNIPGPAAQPFNGNTTGQDMSGGADQFTGLGNWLSQQLSRGPSTDSSGIGQ